jgi:hypothetical protein
VLDDEHGSHLSDDQFVAGQCSAVLDGAPATEPTGRAKFQIAVTVCERCRQGWQTGAGAQIPISPAAVERAMCDAQHVGSIDGATPERAYQDVSPSVARLVWRRDGGRCRVPGCRSARGLELHHLVHRADGGRHDASNLALMCSSCHQAHHDGALVITGTADHLEVRRLAEPISPPAPAAHGGAVDNSNAHVGTAPAGNCDAHVDAMSAIGHSNHNAHVGAVGRGNAATPTWAHRRSSTRRSFARKPRRHW